MPFYSTCHLARRVARGKHVSSNWRFERSVEHGSMPTQFYYIPLRQKLTFVLSTRAASLQTRRSVNRDSFVPYDYYTIASRLPLHTNNDYSLIVLAVRSSELRQDPHAARAVWFSINKYSLPLCLCNDRESPTTASNGLFWDPWTRMTHKFPRCEDLWH